MAPSASSGRASNKNALPYEQKGRMTWDPVYKAKHQDGASSSESDSDDDFVDGDYPVGPYVSGGLQTGQPTSKAMPARPAPSPTVRVNKIPPNGVTHDGFQRVSYRRPQKHRMPHRVHLNFNRDNTAKAAFRKREKPSGQFVLPRDCNEIEPNRARMYDYLEELGVRLGSFIRPPQHIRDRTLFLWGNTEQISRTGAELLNWLNPTPKAIGSRYQGKENFADIYSVKGDKYKQLQKKIKRDADVRRFQQEPAKGTTFDYTGSFLWPVDEIAPTDLLGAGLEALDPLRIKFQCHIVFDARLTVFKILTNDMESVKRTLARIQGIMKEYVARISRPIVRYYIEPPDPSSYRDDIKNVPSDSLVPKSGSAILPLMTGKPLEPGAYEQWRRQSASLRAQSDRGIEEALHKTIPHLRFYRGQVRIRVHFGTFALAVFRWPGTAESIAFEDFMKNIAMAGTKGNMIRDLQIKKDATFIISNIHAANNLFQPIDNFTNSLAEVSPCFSAYLECQEYEKPPVKLEVEMACNTTDANLYEKAYARWSRAGRGDNVTPLEVFMARLDGGPSWKFQVSTENILDSTRTTPKMKDFAESVKMKKASDAKVELTGEKVFDWDRIPGSMLVSSFSQKTSLRFRLVRNMEYTIEISRYDTYEHPSAKKPQTTDWAANLWNSDWDSELMANTSLSIGDSADWDPRLTTFFPDPYGVVTTEGGISAGLKEFIEIAGEVNSFLGDIKKQLPHLRG